jgi:hypothetical protein
MKDHRASSSVFEFRESMARSEAPNKPHINCVKLFNGMQFRNMASSHVQVKDLDELESNYLGKVMQRKRKIFESYNSRKKPKE